MFCENCGNPMSDTAKFCGKCGYKVSDFTIPQPAQAEPPAPVAPDNLDLDATVEVAPVVSESVQPAQLDLDATVVAMPTIPAPVAEPAQPVVPPVQQPVYDYTPSYQNTYDPYQPTYDPKPKKKKHTGLIVAAVLAVVVVVGVLLWIFVLSGNDLEGTSWISEEGIELVFIDDKNGYLDYGDEGHMEFTYTVDGSDLSMRYNGQTMKVGFKIKGDQLFLSNDYGEEIVYYDASNAFECEYCYETIVGKKYIGQLDGYSYAFCEDCWEEVRNWLD